MMLRVRERGDDVHIELDGVAGRQQVVLQALAECRQLQGTRDAQAILTEVNVRSGANAMRICLKGKDGFRYETQAIYQCLRSALLNRLRAGTSSSATAAL